MSDESKFFETQVIHAGQSQSSHRGDHAAVFQTPTYAQPWPAKHTGYEYARTRHARRERRAAALEGGTDGTGSGWLPQRLSSKRCCGREDRLRRRPVRRNLPAVHAGSPRRGEVTFEDPTNKAPEDAILEDTTLVWVETQNPLLKVIDIAAVAARCKAIGAMLAVDNTFATPYFQRPLSLGADLVVHSTTKYLNGHSDVVGGMVLTADPTIAANIRFIQNAAGAVPGPWDSWLTLRGLKTLAVRMARHEENAQAVLAWLQQCSDVSRIHYPLLPSDPGYAVASKQMSGFGGMISVCSTCHSTAQSASSPRPVLRWQSRWAAWSL